MNEATQFIDVRLSVCVYKYILFNSPYEQNLAYSMCVRQYSHCNSLWEICMEMLTHTNLTTTKHTRMWWQAQESPCRFYILGGVWENGKNVHNFALNRLYACIRVDTGHELICMKNENIVPSMNWRISSQTPRKIAKLLKKCTFLVDSERGPPGRGQKPLICSKIGQIFEFAWVFLALFWNSGNPLWIFTGTSYHFWALPPPPFWERLCQNVWYRLETHDKKNSEGKKWLKNKARCVHFTKHPLSHTTIRCT